MQESPTLVLEQRIAEIRRTFEPAIGAMLHRYSTAELLHDDGKWDAWTDLPIRIEWGADGLIAVSWSKFDDLWLRTDASLPFSIEGLTVPWVHNSIDRLFVRVSTGVRTCPSKLSPIKDTPYRSL